VASGAGVVGVTMLVIVVLVVLVHGVVFVLDNVPVARRIGDLLHDGDWYADLDFAVFLNGEHLNDGDFLRSWDLYLHRHLFGYGHGDLSLAHNLLGNMDNDLL